LFFSSGLRTDQNISNELILVQRWGLLASVVATIMVVRFLYVALAIPAMDRRKAATAKAPVVEVEQSWLRKNIGKVMVAFLLIFPPLMVMSVGLQGSLKWIDNFGIQILIYVMLAWGLNIVVGLAGLLDLGYVAFYAVGAYAYALLGTHFGWSFWLLLPAAGIMAAFWGVILGFPVLRLRGDYLAIVTLGVWRDHPAGSDQLARSHQRRSRHFGSPERSASSAWFSVQCLGPGLHREGVRHSAIGRVLQDLPLLPDPGVVPADGLCDDAGCGVCRLAAPGRLCVKTRSPAGRWASTPRPPS
jgi:hypothetical protein